MEGPIEFDILGKVKPDEKNEAYKWLERNLGFKKIDARKLIIKAAKTNEQITVASSLGWNEVLALLDNAPGGFSELIIVESSYFIDEYMKHCSKHNLYFASTDSCPVCTGWYLNTNENGDKVQA